MKCTKSIVTLFMCILLLTSGVPAFAESQSINLSLDEARAMAIEYSPQIRSVGNQEIEIKETIRKNIQQSYMIEAGLDKYYEFANDYEASLSSEGKYYQYIGRTEDALKTTIMGLYNQIGQAAKTGQYHKIPEFQDKIDFLQLYIYFGDNPNLTKEDKYRVYKKNQEMLINSVDLIQTKYDTGLSATINSVDSGIIQLYIGLYDMEQGYELKKDLLSTYEEGFKNLETSYNQGLVSKNEYENQKMSLEKQRLEVENLKLSYDNLLYQLKNMCGIDMGTSVNLTTRFDHSNYKLEKPAFYYESSYDTNMTYINTVSELEYNEKNFAVMNKYLDDIDKDTDKVIYYQEKEDMKDTLANLKEKLKDTELFIQYDINFAYNELTLLKKKIENGNQSLSYAAEQTNSAIQMYQLGQITQLDLDKAKLNYANTVFEHEKHIRSYNTNIEKFKLLINYGISYTKPLGQ